MKKTEESQKWYLKTIMMLYLKKTKLHCGKSTWMLQGWHIRHFI